MRCQETPCSTANSFRLSQKLTTRPSHKAFREHRKYGRENTVSRLAPVMRRGQKRVRARRKQPSGLRAAKLKPSGIFELPRPAGRGSGVLADPGNHRIDPSGPDDSDMTVYLIARPIVRHLPEVPFHIIHTYRDRVVRVDFCEGNGSIPLSPLYQHWYLPNTPASCNLGRQAAQGDRRPCWDPMDPILPASVPSAGGFVQRPPTV